MPYIHLEDSDGVVCGTDPQLGEPSTLNIDGTTCILCLRKYATDLHSCLQDLRDRFVSNEDPDDPLIQEAERLLM